MGQGERGRAEGRQQKQQLHNSVCCTAAKSTQHTRATTQPPGLHSADRTSHVGKRRGTLVYVAFGSSNPRVCHWKCQTFPAMSKGNNWILFIYRKTSPAPEPYSKNSRARLASCCLMRRSLGLFVFQRVTEWKRTFLFLPAGVTATVSYQLQQRNSCLSSAYWECPCHSPGSSMRYVIWLWFQVRSILKKKV